jgi:putative transposase
MPRKHYKPYEIVAKLRQFDVLVSQGRSVADAVRAVGVAEVTYYLYGRLTLRKPILN